MFAPNTAPPKLTIGLIGYPNVGKSSTINALLGSKRVSVSSTPGKTKHFQTLHLSPSIVLCDCPGLVFPQFTTTSAELVVDGVLPVDQMREYTSPVEILCRRIDEEVLGLMYGLEIGRKGVEEGGDGLVHATDMLRSYAGETYFLLANDWLKLKQRWFNSTVARGFTRAGQGNPDEARAARYILKDYINGKLLWVHPPPSYVPPAATSTVEETEGIPQTAPTISIPLTTDAGQAFNYAQQQTTLEALRQAGKKKAPVTRVGKDASTFIATLSQSGGTAKGGGLKGRAVDDDFFKEGTGLSDKPFVRGSKIGVGVTGGEGVGVGGAGDEYVGRVMHYPHQKVVGNDGKVVDGGLKIPIPVGKKHYKGTKNVKKRSGKGYD